MTESKPQNYVVLIDRDKKDQSRAISSKLHDVVGVVVSAESKSSVDITADENVIGQKELEGIVRKLGAELHALPQAQLIDPIPTKKIP